MKKLVLGLAVLALVCVGFGNVQACPPNQVQLQSFAVPQQFVQFQTVPVVQHQVVQLAQPVQQVQVVRAANQVQVVHNVNAVRAVNVNAARVRVIPQRTRTVTRTVTR